MTFDHPGGGAYFGYSPVSFGLGDPFAETLRQLVFAGTNTSVTSSVSVQVLRLLSLAVLNLSSTSAPGHLFLRHLAVAADNDTSIADVELSINMLRSLVLNAANATATSSPIIRALRQLTVDVGNQTDVPAVSSSILRLLLFAPDNVTNLPNVAFNMEGVRLLTFNALNATSTSYPQIFKIIRLIAGAANDTVVSTIASVLERHLTLYGATETICDDVTAQVLRKLNVDVSNATYVPDAFFAGTALANLVNLAVLLLDSEYEVQLLDNGLEAVLTD